MGISCKKETVSPPEIAEYYGTIEVLKNQETWSAKITDIFAHDRRINSSPIRAHAHITTSNSPEDNLQMHTCFVC